MFAALKQFFAMFSVLFAAGEKAAKALDHLATLGEEQAQAYVNETRLRNQFALEQLRRQQQSNPQAIASPIEQQP